VLITNTPFRTTNEKQKNQILKVKHLENGNKINTPNCPEKTTFLPKISRFHGRMLQVGLRRAYCQSDTQNDSMGAPLKQRLIQTVIDFAMVWFNCLVKNCPIQCMNFGTNRFGIVSANEGC
jgi:hypothetical protein